MKNIYSILTCFILIQCSISNAQNEITIGNTTLIETEMAVDAVYTPWEIQWGPDNHIWITEREGRVQRMDPETGVMTEVLDYENEVNYVAVEPGMLGMCFHPDFENTPLVYIVYSSPSGGSFRNTLESFEWNGTALVNSTVIMDNIYAGGIHAGSRIIITQDEKILMTTGDGGDGGSSSQNMNSLGGKILRLNLDGSIPDDNPTAGSYVYSYGHRNPQGLVQAPDGKIYSSEHGQSAQDELNLIEPTKNYGWPDVEGFCDDFPSAFEPNDCEAEGFTEPLIEWRPCMAINDLIYYEHPNIPEFNNTLLMCVMRGFSNQSDRGLFIIHLNEDGTQVTFDEDEDIIISNRGRLRDICVDPNTGTLYIASNGGNYTNSGPNSIYRYQPDLLDNVDEISSQGLSVYPNPSAGNVNFEIIPELVGGVYEVISYDGKTVLEGSVNTENFTLNAGELNAGSYYMVITSDKGNVSKSFVIQ